MTKKIALEQLYNQARECLNCPFGKTEENHKVFGEGNPGSKLLFIGEAPGADEDRLKRPFVGRAGRLLNTCFEEAGFKREDIYITNIVKCRPPENRTPNQNEISADMKNLLRQEITIIQPKVICTLGATSTKLFLGEQVAMTKIHGHVYTFGNFKVIPVFHPAYILRNPVAKKDLVQDLCAAYALSHE